MSRTGLGWLPAAIADLADRDLLRVLTYCQGAPDAEVTIDGVPHLLLASNNYLGLANDPAVVAGARAALGEYGAGAGASRLVTGSLDLHRRLEERIAALKSCEDALVFPTGFQANVGTIPALVQRGDAVFSDELNHASLIDGCRLSGAEVVRYPHADADALEAAVVAAGAGGRRLIVTDTVFSMDGDLAPLPAIVAIAERHGCMVMVDEAHATGVLGATGAGALEHFGLEGRVPVVMGTLSLGFLALPGRAESLATGTGGLFYTGSLHQLGTQALGLLAVGVFTFTASFGVLWAMKRTFGIRTEPEVETAGLDVSEHGMWGYPEFYIPVPGGYGTEAHGHLGLPQPARVAAVAAHHATVLPEPS